MIEAAKHRIKELGSVTSYEVVNMLIQRRLVVSIDGMEERMQCEFVKDVIMFVGMTLVDNQKSTDRRTETV